MPPDRATRGLIDELQRRPHASLHRAALALSWRRLSLALLFRSLHAAGVLAAPVLAYFLLRWLSSDQPSWIGVICTVGIGASTLAAATCRRLSDGYAQEASLQARRALCGLTYLCAQQLDWASLSARHIASRAHPSSDISHAPVGQLSELLGTAAADVGEWCPAMVAMAVLPAEVVAALGILYAITGVASAGAVGVMMLTFAASHCSGLSLERLALRKRAASGLFQEALAETLAGVQTVKLCGWTAAFEERRQTDTRRHETRKTCF